jgi:NADH:ubiquinone oxidoreductase subunit 5 (subunit L)/multisubunit Na+/H+ antiporter MnhA subunit
MAAAVALTQNDLKKVIAYSTCSQLGYMVVSCAINSFKPAFFHLFTHGFFKALLFLSAGLLIHSLNQEQDIRKMGGLLLQKPISYIFFLTGSLALIGFPSLSGYYSKDSILDQLALYTNGGFLVNLACLALFFTSSYSYKVLYLVFITKPQGFKKTYTSISNQKEAPFFVLFLLTFLCLFSIFSGYLVQDLFFGIGNFFFNFSLSNSIDLSILTESLIFQSKSFPFICIFISNIFVYI